MAQNSSCAGRYRKRAVRRGAGDAGKSWVTAPSVSVTFVTLRRGSIAETRSTNGELFQSAHIELQVAAICVLHHSLTAKEIKTRRDALAARCGHLRDVLLREIGRNFDERAGRTAELACEIHQRLCDPMDGVVVRQGVDLRIRLFQRGADSIEQHR